MSEVIDASGSEGWDPLNKLSRVIPSQALFFVPQHRSIDVLSIYLIIFIIINFVFFVILPHTFLLTTAAIFLFGLISKEPITIMKIPSKTENRFLPTIPSALESSVH